MSFKIAKSRDSRLDEGVWATFRGSQFKIAHVSNLKFQRVLAKLQAPHRKAIDKGNLDYEDSRQIVSESLAQGILRDWKDVVDEDNQPVNYNPKLGAEAILNDEELREFIQEYATTLTHFRDEELADKGNG
jgi:hypothetical protein